MNFYSMIKLSLTSKVILGIFKAIPLGVRKAFFTWLAMIGYHLSPRRRLIAIHNIRRAFPEKSLSEVIKIAKGVYKNFAIVAAEFFEIPSLNMEIINRTIEVEGLDNCRKALEKNKGLLMFGAHFGNWELQAAAFAILLKPLMVIYRPLDNKILENIVTGIRSATGNIPVDKRFAMRKMLRFLKDNGGLGILIDQNWAWQEGCFVDFFGRPACTTNGLAIIALHTEAPVIPAFMVRMPDGKYRIIIEKEVDIIKTDNRESDIVVNTQRFTKIIEDMVRRYPDQWFWVHQRWKTHPSQMNKEKKRSSNDSKVPFG